MDSIGPTGIVPVVGGGPVMTGFSFAGKGDPRPGLLAGGLGIPRADISGEQPP
jgi:hypothetical protein